MLRLLVYTFLLIFFAAGAAWLAAYPGSVTMVWLGWRLDATMAALIAALVVICAFTAFWALLIRALLLVPRRMRRRKRDRAYGLGLRSATEGLVALAIGDVETARHRAKKTRQHLHDAPLALLLSAQIARVDGKDADLRRYLEQLLAHRETRFLAARNLSAYCDRNDNASAALDYAEQAHTMRPKDPVSSENLVGLYTRLGRWEEAERALRQAGRGMSRPERQRLRGLSALAQAVKLEEAGQPALARDAALQATRLLPGFAPASALAARLLAADGHKATAIKVLHSSWKHTPHPMLASTLSAILVDAPLKTLMKFQRRMAAIHPEHPESHLLLAQGALQNRDWKTARHSLSAALAHEETIRGCRLMVELERDAYGDDEATARWQIRAENAKEGVWECESCHHTTPHWQPHCPTCHAFGKFLWRSRGVKAKASPAPEAELLPLLS